MSFAFDMTGRTTLLLEGEQDPEEDLDTKNDTNSRIRRNKVVNRCVYIVDRSHCCQGLRPQHDDMTQVHSLIWKLYSWS